MLFFLTGSIGIGKTRWLEGLVGQLEERGVEPCGVLAPGRWVEIDVTDAGTTDAGAPEAGSSGPDDPASRDKPPKRARQRALGPGTTAARQRFEKIGIDNVLLPGRERITFACRADLVPDDESAFSQAQRARLGWLIQDSAIERVNRHFNDLAASTPHDGAPRLLVVDELGQLELARGCGLVEALCILESAPGNQFSHAVAVVREDLLARALKRLARSPWGALSPIVPNDKGKEAIFEAFSLSLD